MQFSGFQNKENETNRSLTMLKLLFLPGPMVNPGSGINAFIMEFPGFENSRQWPQKAKVMTKIRKTKRASEDML